MKFSIRELLLVTVIVALAVGWWVDRSKLVAKIDLLKNLSRLTHKDAEVGPVNSRVVSPSPNWITPTHGESPELPNSSAPAPNPPKE